MAELALAIIPLGITVTSGLVKYLKSFKDHDDDRTRLVRQAEGFTRTFQSLEAVLKRSQLSPELSISVSEASVCLRECQKALEELDTLQQKIFVTSSSAVAMTSHARTKDKIKDGCKKALYPLRKSDIEALQDSLNNLSTTLNLALGMLQLDEQSLARKVLNEQMVEIKKNTIINSNTSTVVEELQQPISRIDLTLPVLQTSVDSIVPQLDQRFDQITYQQLQIQAQIKSFFDMASATRYQDRLGVNQQFSYSHSGRQDNYLPARETEPELHTLSKKSGLVSMCSCRLRRVRQRKTFALGPVHFAEEMLSGPSHEKECVFFIPSSACQKTRTLRFTGLESLLRNGFELSFSTRAHAGRFSISPSFASFPVVDEKVAPAFLVMSILGDQKLQELFCSGRASPNDVTQESQTLLHYLSDSIYCELILAKGANSPFLRSTCEGLLNFLVAAGTSVTVRNRHGHLALHRVIGLAVIRNNLQEVERLVSLRPHILKERSTYRETPLHVAIYRLDILEVLAKKTNPEIWIQHDHEGATILNLAMEVSHEICNSEEYLDGLCCPCTLPLRIILANGCPIIPHRDFCRLVDPYPRDPSFFKASFHCKTLLAKELRSRRQQLRDLARNHLSITELSSFTASEEVPDIDAMEMDRLLRQKGIFGLGPLSTFVEEDLDQQPLPDVTYYSRSIFVDLKSPEDADLFTDFGFKVICADQDHVSSLYKASFADDFPLSRYISLDYAIWLFERQAPLWKWSYRFSSPMPSAFVLADIRGMQDRKCPGQDNIRDKAEHYVSESDLVDACSCLCSPDGCTPFTSRMKWLAHSYNQFEELVLQDYTARFGSFVEKYGRSLNLSHQVIMVRQATFAALDLKHTCLDRPGYSHHPESIYPMYWLDPVTELEPDEKEFELLTVDVEAVNQLEEMVVTFQDFVLTGRQTTAPSKSESCDIDYSIFNEPSALGIDDLYYQRVLEFWQHIWSKRMQVALDTVVEKWDNKLDGQNDLVQISTCEEAVQETRDIFGGGIDDEVIFNQIIQRIQDI
ncbi:hypothetical protein FGADI_1021 [Fusarium gaditjirri]|uniref:Azaphilone pigments biosynthesis cluster protein L N-terminal domain-containing protein n=1 Tax=Fusarium gaditjirri TaxID=282569 RepID=A0A8H4TM89_9HYPO|nr:hypothetical protein FGADI_1021 [Fusarium gaditjirri]